MTPWKPWVYGLPLKDVIQEMFGDGIMSAIDLARYRKATRGPKKPVARKVYKNGGHVSTHKLLQRQE